jgi:hypothetical protein
LLKEALHARSGAVVGGVVLIRSKKQELEAAPAAFLDHAEELRMGLSNAQLIHEAIECNHAGVGQKGPGWSAPYRKSYLSGIAIRLSPFSGRR